MSDTCPILVLGVGNLLRSDEGVGVHAARALEPSKLPAGAKVVDAGIAVADALSSYKSIGKLVVVDAVDAKAEPGSVFRFRPRDVERRRALLRSLHELDLFDALEMAERGGCTVGEVIVVGVQPKTIDWGMDLSREVRERLPDVVRLVESELLPPGQEGEK
ncbi:MAG: HyaD/HybD family hydrogenase maturation endopeptidase [Armatimonadota bacterium]|nr:MAG: HyaD/HybD family hydrogenase maturation endopeptidase [Armatimonadota bacterium]